MRRSLNMFTLIGLGVGVACVYSLIATIRPDLFPDSFRDENGQVGVYFEAAAVIVTLVLVGQVLELRARARTGAAIRALLGLAPKTARRLKPDGWEEDVAARRRAPGRSAARAAGRERAGRRRRDRGQERGRRVDDHRRADSGGEEPSAIRSSAARSTAPARW